MEHFLATTFLGKLKKGPPPEEEEPFLSLKGDEVFCIYELVQIILSHLPALDLLVLQMVNRTCRDVVKFSAEFQMKLFMQQDPPEGDEHWGTEFDANGLRWNPFLEHFGVMIERGPHDPRIRIRREHLRKHDGAEASWKRMFLTYPTRMEFRAYLEGRFWIDGTLNCRYDSKVKAENMRFLMEADRGCYNNHSHHGHQSKRNDFIIFAEDWRHEAVRKLPEKRLRSNERLQSEFIEYQGCDGRSMSKKS